MTLVTLNLKYLSTAIMQWQSALHIILLRLAIEIYGNEIFWVGDKVAQDMYNLKWHPRIENLADYQSKHHMGSHHTAIRSYYLHQDNSPRIIPCALRLSTLKGCVETLDGG
jgi:hypothetical protein